MRPRPTRRHLSRALITAARDSWRSQKALAIEIDAHPTHVCHWLYGRPVPETARADRQIAALCALLGVPTHLAFERRAIGALAAPETKLVHTETQFRSRDFLRTRRPNLMKSTRQIRADRSLLNGSEVERAKGPDNV
jgi:hypothetical protein